MSTAAEQLPKFRPQFFPGEVLTADDLTAGIDADTGLRRLHHRMLHGWGIASGLAVSGRRGDTLVSVAHGYALDVGGRELILPAPVTVPVPPVAAGPDGNPLPFSLIVRWTDDEDAVVVDRPGLCGAEGAVRRSDEPTVAWLDPAAVRDGLDVVLAEVLIQGCRLGAEPDGAARRLLNPPPTPYAMCGKTVSGETGWGVRASSGGQPWAVFTVVDTSEAGFGDTPVYLPRLVGARKLAAADSPTGTEVLLDGAPFVEDAEPGRFRFVVPLAPGDPVGAVAVNPQNVIGRADFADLVAATLQWSVEWIGLQQ
jgi:hypothetical protein